MQESAPARPVAHSSPKGSAPRGAAAAPHLYAWLALAALTSACDSPGSGAGAGGTSATAGTAGQSTGGQGGTSSGTAGAPSAGQAGAGTGGMEPIPTLLGPGIFQADLGSGGSSGGAAGSSGVGGTAGADPGGGNGPPVLAPECFASVLTVPAAAPLLVVPRTASVAPWLARELGVGRHPLAAGCNALGLTFIDRASDPATLSLALFDQAGTPGIVLSFGSVNALSPSPGVAAFPDDTFAVAWADVDGDEQGILLRKIDAAAPMQAAALVANAQQSFAQFNPDLVFDGTRLIVAWTDSSDAANGPDLRYRLFSRDLSPLSDDLSLAATSAAEDNVALAAANGAWAAAWRAGLNGNETIEAQLSGVHWTVGPFLPGEADDRPALVFLDANHLALAFTEGTDPTASGIADTPRLFGAVLDTAFPGDVLPFPIAPTVDPYASDPTIGQSQPALERVGDELRVAWRSSARSGDALAEELWQRSITWSPGPSNSVLIDTTASEQPLISSASLRSGDQRAPALLNPPFGTPGNVVSAWQDEGRVFGATEGVPDVALQFSGAQGGLSFLQVSISENYFTCATVNDHTARCWGDNSKGQLGNDSTTSSSTPVVVSGLSNVISVAAAGSSACALLADGTVRCWGDNSFGQLGDGTTTAHSTPAPPVNGVANAIALSAGQWHVCALISDGTVRCWGWNAYGQIGAGSDGTGYPIAGRGYAVNKLSGVTALAAGSFHTCALLATGSVQCWGEGMLGQLGNGVTAIAWEPVTVTGITSATQLGSGDSHSCAVLADGTAQCWGDETFGQLGNGVTGLTFGQTHSAVPVAVAGLTGVAQIAPAFTFTCARLLDKSVKCWGRNQDGELGDGTGVAHLSPTAVPGARNSLGLVASDLSACAQLVSGRTVCWGYNQYGGLGDGNNTNALSPTEVLFP